MVYITGDTHGDFERITKFCVENETSAKDILIILGDAGINYHLSDRDEELKSELSKLPITFFLIHGNHEERPENIQTYLDKRWHGGMVYYEDAYPNLLFAADGEIYDINGSRSIVIGGAYSVDKYYRLRNGLSWFESEQPTEHTKIFVESQLEKYDWQVDFVLSHTGPTKFIPEDLFLPTIDQSNVDRSTEDWLDEVEEKLDYYHWFFGHYHADRLMGQHSILFQYIEDLDDF